MCNITTDELVGLIKNPESKMVVRRILNLLQAESTLNELVNDLNTAMAKSVDNNEQYELLKAIFALAVQARENLKKERDYASVW